MLGSFLWANGQLHLRPGRVDPFQLHSKLGSPQDFAVGKFSISEYESPAFDAVLVEHTEGYAPSERLLRFLIRNEIMSYDREARAKRRVAATSEDTESAGQNVGFLREPKSELYPPLFQGSKTVPVEVRSKLKAHVLNVLELEFINPDQWIYFTIYGSGISYNWDEGGDLDLQMWVDHEKYMQQGGEDMTVDDLIASVRRNVQKVNFPSFKDLGLTSPAGSKEEADGSMLIQYYPKPGKGTPEENLASKPYACYDLETDEWLEEPEPIEPTFYGEQFVMLLPKAEDIALQAEALISEYERDILNWQFWFALNSQSGDPAYQDQMLESKDRAEQEKAGIKNLFDGVFQGRAKAYSPEGKGIEDERDMVQKLLEVWGIFQKLKHYAREPLPWDEQEMPAEPKAAQLIRQANFVVYSANVRELADKMLKRIVQEQYTPWAMKLEKQKAWLEEQGAGPNEIRMLTEARINWFMTAFTDLNRNAPETYKLWPWLWRTFKKNVTTQGDPVLNPTGHIIDILRQAGQHLDKLRDNPTERVPDIMQFQGFNDLEAWVYEMNSKMVAEGEPKPNREIYNYPDGWTIQQLHPDNLPWEGDQMGHCVGGYCTYVARGDTHIFSLRDEKGFPHVTFEVKGQKPLREQMQWQGETIYGLDQPGADALTKTDRAWKVIQIQGKQDKEPIPEYKERLKQFFEEIRGSGIAVEWSDEAYRHGYGLDGTDSWNLYRPEDLDEWYAHFGQEGYIPKSKRDRPIDDYGLPVPASEFDITEVDMVEKIAEALVDDYSKRATIRPVEIPYYVKALLAAMYEKYGTEQQAKHQLFLAAERGQEHLDTAVNVNRDSNWDYFYERVRTNWNDENDEDFDEWYQDNDDPYGDERYLKYEEEITNEFYEPYEYAYKFITALMEASGRLGVPESEQTPAPTIQQDVEQDAQTPSTLDMPGTFAKKASTETDQLADAILSSGGGTFDYNLFPAQKEDGYWVSVEGAEEVVPRTNLKERIEDYLGLVGEFLEDEDLWFGAWVDGDEVYLDVTRWFEDKEEALQFGRDNHQRAIWDISTEDPISVTSGIKMAALRGLPQSAMGPYPDVQDLAQAYAEGRGMDYQPPQDYIPVDPERARAIAQEYDTMQHNPQDPAVKASYDAFKQETLEQYQHLISNGFVFEFYPDDVDPYPKGPRQALEDLHQNKHLYVYPTEAGFGTLQDDPYSDHPLLEDSGIRWNGKPVTFNDVFRGVHDVFGHAKEGVGFRWDGEDNAWRQHAAMYSELARPAMTAETRGQNSWVNFGPHGEANQIANQAETIYADQKAGILPEWVHQDSVFNTTPGGIGTFSMVKEAEPGYPSPEHNDPGGWQGIMEKAQRLRTEQAVDIQLNAPDHVMGIVEGDHGTYQTELWRDDPNAQAITLWDCDCQWEDYSWGRTRQWKKYEGRPCSHTLALYWESMSTPLDTDAYFGDEGQPALPQEYLPSSLPSGPAPQPVQAPQSVPVQPQPGEQLVLPGTFSKWRKSSAFINGDYVRLNTAMEGYDEDGGFHRVPRNKIAEVIWSDEEETIVIVSTELGRLQAHNIRITGPTAAFSWVPREKGTAPRRHR
jgi:hypothetical protein